MMPHLIKLLSLLASLSTLLITGGCANQKFYYPDSFDYTRGESAKVHHEEVYFTSEDGTRLHGWFMPSETKEAKATVIHFHGNAQNLSSHFIYSAWMPRAGYNVLIFDYRGYGKSEGHINRQGAYEDCEAALRYIKERRDVDPDKLLLFGQSLGGAHALAVMKSPESEGVRALVIESSFYSYRDIGRSAIKRIPIVGLLRYPLSFVLFTDKHSPRDSLKYLDVEPVLYIHPQQDTVVPIEQFNKLYAETRNVAKFWVPKRLNHLQVYHFLPDKYIHNVDSFFTLALE
jgi:fermentation-respiration switch protein FrsA (DUF1100 family)